MISFLPQNDRLAHLINAQATLLHEQMKTLDAEKLGMPEHCLAYFAGRHAGRLFFSIEASAHLLYRSLTLTGKDPANTVLMDHGAGVGTLYVLAKMIGCSKVVYNDHLDDWRLSAQLIAEALGVQIDEYMVGDIDACLDRLEELGVHLDAIVSRNVIEHIYQLDVFYNTVYKRQPNAVIVSSTSANKKNPAVLVKHVRWHRKWEKVYLGKRRALIERQSPGLTATKMKAIARSTRGLAGKDLEQAVEEYRRTGRLPDPSEFGTNTCDPSNGVWAENMIGAKEFKSLINEQHYRVSLEPGFWDTHYDSALMNAIGRRLNQMIVSKSKLALVVAPFIYVIAIPRK